MISKKDALALGLLAIGGIGIASTIAGSGEKEGVGVSGGTGFKPYAGIVGNTETVTDNGDNAGYAPIVLPPEGKVTFPPVPAFRIPEFPFTPEAGEVTSREVKSTSSSGGSGTVFPTGVPKLPPQKKTYRKYKRSVAPPEITRTEDKPKVITQGKPIVGGHPERNWFGALPSLFHRDTTEKSSKKTAYISSGGSSRRITSGGSTPKTASSTAKAAAAPKSKKKPRSYGFTAKSLGGGWSTGY